MTVCTEVAILSLSVSIFNSIACEGELKQILIKAATKCREGDGMGTFNHLNKEGAKNITRQVSLVLNAAIFASVLLTLSDSSQSIQSSCKPADTDS